MLDRRRFVLGNGLVCCGVGKNEVRSDYTVIVLDRLQAQNTLQEHAGNTVPNPQDVLAFGANTWRHAANLDQVTGGIG